MCWQSMSLAGYVTLPKQHVMTASQHAVFLSDCITGAEGSAFSNDSKDKFTHTGGAVAGQAAAEVSKWVQLCKEGADGQKNIKALEGLKEGRKGDNLRPGLSGCCVHAHLAFALHCMLVHLLNPSLHAVLFSLSLSHALYILLLCLVLQWSK